MLQRLRNVDWQIHDKKKKKKNYFLLKLRLQINLIKNFA